MNTVNSAAMNSIAISTNGTNTSPDTGYIADLSVDPEIQLIPKGTRCALQMLLVQGGDGVDGWFKKAGNGESTGLDARFRVLDGPYMNRMIFNKFTMQGNNHDKAIRMSHAMLRNIKESVYNVRPDPTKSSPEWLDLMKIKKSYGEFHGLCFLAEIGIRPADGQFQAKNIISAVITPDMPGYFKVAQAPIPPPIYPSQRAAGDAPQAASGAPGTPGAIAMPAPAVPAPAATGVTKPSWA
jgi:hypothetical protein